MPTDLSVQNLLFRKRTRSHTPSLVLISLALAGLLFQPGCLFRKHTPPSAPTLPAPVRIALLPLNVPQGNTDLRWVSLASAVLEAQTAMAAPDLDPAPLWESMPAVLQSLGTSRTVTSDIAELTAARLTARWSIAGDLKPAGNGISMLMDFIPARTTLVPFRYEQTGGMDALEPRFQEAFDQFLRYLIVRPISLDKLKPLDAKKLKEIAEALDVEYGWFVPAKPGQAGKLVEDLVHTDPGLARLLFSPTLYPGVGK